MIRIATRHAAGSEEGIPTPEVPTELVEATTRLAGVLRDLSLLGRAPVPLDEPPGETTTAWADDEFLYIEAHAPDELDASIDVSTFGRKVFVRIERNRDHRDEPPRPTRRGTEPAGAWDGAIRGKPAIRNEQ